MARSVYCVLILLMAGSDALAQRFSTAGMGLKIGYSQNANFESPNTALNMPLPSTSFFIYNSFRLQKDTTKKHIFEVLKVSLSGSRRGGIFDVNGTATRINMTFVDLDILLPLRVAISRNLNMQFSLGPNLAFKVRQESNTPEAPTFQPGVMYELGLATMRGSFFGFSFSQSFTAYALGNVSFVFGWNVGDIWKSARMKRDGFP